MNVSFQLKILVSIVSINTIFYNAFAEENKALLQENSHEMKMTIQENKLSVSFLDDLWEQRQTKEGAKKIAEFLLSDPKLPRDFEINWRLARLVYYSGNFTLIQKSQKEEKLKVFKMGYTAGEIARELEPKRVEGHYWYAINLGSYGLEKGIFSALNNAKPGRDALLEAVKIDPTYQWCGPLRILGRYYQEVPGGIISFGDKKIAKEYFEKAIDSCPDFRINTMYLGVLKEKTGNKQEALELFKKAQKLPELDGKNEEMRYAKELAENIKNVQNM
ncbi:hypothetical protein [Silvanigrella aquatica]|uniref:Uncharacterized protein n=1 Tax=Silvanigrella aquatica TaxID=1915309 RepID=A0A1L4CX68_9BACT|nr:hypothetical protein [Silvanigrella aquatica]APJ02536.1 hypothetical protein AXG55_00735 [Silvanigrella aquatica]